MNTSIRTTTLLLILCILAACSRGAPPPPTATPAAAIPAPLPTPDPREWGNGGTLITTLGARDPNTLDPALVSDVTSAMVVRQLFSGLLRLDNELEVQPDLAEAWEVSDDGLTYTFTLRDDARFADGTPITAEDVRYSLERATDPALAEFLPAATYLNDIVGVPEKLTGQVNSIAGIEVIDAQTIAITIDAPKAYFLAKLAHPTSFVVDRQAVERAGDEWFERPNGSGPFTIEEWRHDQVLTLMRNVNFYREPAKLDRIRFLMGAEGANPLVLYEQGAIDLTGVPTYALARAQDENGPLFGELQSVPQLSITYIGVNPNLPPFDDEKVRQAFTLLIDRARLANVTLAEGVQPARGILPPGIPGYNPELPPVEPDPAEVRRLLDESRYGGAANLPPIAAYGSWAGTLAEVAEEEFDIEIEVRDYEDYGQYLEELQRGNFQIYGTGWVADYPDPENFLDVLFRTGATYNYSRYSNSTVDGLLDAAAVEEDPNLRYDLYQQAEQLILADGAVIPLYHDIEHVLVKPYVTGLEITPLGILDFSTVELLR